jgi:hypothetical protein
MLPLFHVKATLTIWWYCCGRYGHSMVLNSVKDWAPVRVLAHHLVVGSPSLTILLPGRFEVIAHGDLHSVVGTVLPEKVCCNGWGLH